MAAVLSPLPCVHIVYKVNSSTGFCLINSPFEAAACFNSCLPGAIDWKEWHLIQPTWSHPEKEIEFVLPIYGLTLYVLEFSEENQS